MKIILLLLFSIACVFAETNKFSATVKEVWEPYEIVETNSAGKVRTNYWLHIRYVTNDISLQKTVPAIKIIITKKYSYFEIYYTTNYYVTNGYFYFYNQAVTDYQKYKLEEWGIITIENKQKISNAIKK